MMHVIKLTLVFFILAMFSSCSGSKNPLDPVNANSMDNSGKQISDFEISNRLYPNVLGAWEVNVDVEKLSAEITPARNASKIGDIFDADLSQFLTVTPCANCLMIAGVSVDAYANILLDVRMKHPFGNINTRPDLHGFDVRAIVITKSDWSQYPSTTITKPDGTEERVKFDPWFLLNADGFTSHYDELVNDTRYFIYGEDCPANINPYVRFFESYTMGAFDPHNPSGYNVMPVGANTYGRTMVFTGYQSFGFYIVADVAYGQSAVLANRTNPQYYLPAFNRTEPWRTEYWIENNDLKWDDSNSSADVVVQVFDWQHSATVDPAYPSPSNPSGIKESSRVTKVELVMPSLQDAPVVVTVPEAGTGTPTDPLRYRLTVNNTKMSSNALHYGLIAIRDELDGNSSPSGRVPIPESPAGFPYATQDIRDYSYYGVVFVNTTYSDYASNDYKYELFVNPESQVGDQGISVEATFFMDPSHKRFQYRWDYDYDGVTFDLDGAGLPNPWVALSPGKHKFGLRIRTNTVPPKEYIYTIPVYIKGMDYYQQLSTASTTNDISGLGRSHSVAATDEWFYHVYVSKAWGNREIVLGQFSRDETIRIVSQVTSGSFQISDPSIAVIEDGPNAGVYLLFVRGGQIQFVKGDLLGSGFNIANIKTVSMEPFEYAYYPVILYVKDTLFAYYQQNDSMLMTDMIMASKSADYGETWSVPLHIDIVALSQNWPTVAYNESLDRFYCIYSDTRNWTTQRHDLYLAEDYDGDGVDFDYAQNISTQQGLVSEIFPSMVLDGDVLAIAYIALKDSSPNESDLYLKTFINTYTYSNNDARLITGSGHGIRYTAPSIGCASRGQYVIGCGGYENGASEIYTKVIEWTENEPGAYTISNAIVDDLKLITNDLVAADIFPGIICKSVVGGKAVENFVAIKSYDEGYELSNGVYYGQIDMVCVISQVY